MRYTVVTCKIKYLQNICKNVLEWSTSRGFRAVNFPRFTCKHYLSSTCVQHAKTFTKHCKNGLQPSTSCGYAMGV